MKHAGKARRAGLKILLWVIVLFLLLAGVVGLTAGAFLTAALAVLGGLAFLVAAFVISFFRDPSPVVPSQTELILSPAHGTVDVIDEVDEPTFIQGRCKRVSIFLSVFDVHVQNAPITGTVRYMKHCPGQFLNAMRADCSLLNENVLLGIESSEHKGEKIAVRLIAGLIARRIVPWAEEGTTVERGERISLIQFGSRVDLYLPLAAEIKVKLREKVRGGESVIAARS